MITYGSTTLTSYNTITKIEVYYYKSTSATSLSGGSWSTTKPTWESGKYIWQKIRTTYEGKLDNGQTFSESDPVNITGQQGATGTAAYSYKLNASDTIVSVSKNGTYSTNSVTFSATSKQGDGNVNAYAGRFKIETTADGIIWTTQYTSNADESSKIYTIPSDIANIRCSLYQAGGITVLLDIVSVSLVKDGTDGMSQNLLLDVYASSMTKVKAPWNRYLSYTSNTTITGEFIAENNLPDPNATHFYRITDSSASTKGRGLCFYSGGTPPFLNGHTYRIGCWVRNHAGQPRLYISLGSVGEWLPSKTIENTDWEWVECVRTFGDTDPSITSQSDTYKRIYFYLYNNNVEGSSFDMCGFKVEEIQTDISTARNYLLKTEKLQGWGATGNTTTSNGIITFPEVTTNTWREVFPTKNFKYELIRNKNIIFSVRVKADVGKICACCLCIGVDSTETAYTRQKYKNNYVYFTGDGEWHTICTAMPISDELFTGGSGTPNYNDCWVTVRIGAVNTYHNGFQATQPQFSLGTTATAWSAAPEDVEANIQQVQDNLDNIEIGGRNLLRGANTQNVSFGNYKNQVTATEETLFGCTVFKSSLKWADIGFNLRTQVIDKNLVKAGDILTYSIWAKTDDTVDREICGVWVGSYVSGVKMANLTSEWTQYYKTITITQAMIDGTDVVSTRFECNTDCTEGKFIYWAAPKLERGNKPTDWTLAPEDTQADIDTALAQSVEYIIGTQTASTGTWTGVTTDIELKVGKTIAYKLPYAGSGNASLVLTLADGSITDAIPVYLNTTRVTTHFGANSVINMTYDGQYWRASSIPNTNNYDRRQHNGAIKAKVAISKYHLIGGNSTGYQHINASTPFDFGYPILYASGDIEVNKTATSTYEAYPNINFTYTGTIQEGGANKMLWLKGSINGNLFTPASSDYLTTIIPTSDDGMYYIPLGVMTSATNGYFSSSNRIYGYVDDMFQPLDNAAVLRAQSAKNFATATYGLCDTEATTAEKIVECPNFVLFEGARIQIAFTYANTEAIPTLNINNTGVKNIKIGIVECSDANPLYWGSDTQIEFVYDGTDWIIQNAPMTLYGVCSTEQNIAEKIVMCDGAVVCKGTIMYVSMNYSNTAANASLNVADIGAIIINANNEPLSMPSRFNWNAETNPCFTFDGQCWQMDNDTVSAYIADTNDNGIFIHPIDDMSSGWSIGSAIQLFKQNIDYIKLWIENTIAKIRIGREDQGHIILDNESVTINGVKNAETVKELASFSPIGITFDDKTPYKIGNDETYVQFVDTDEDGVADSLEIVADNISFRNSTSIQNELNVLQNKTDKTSDSLQGVINELNDKDYETRVAQLETNAVERNKYININTSEPSITIATEQGQNNTSLKLQSDKLSFISNSNETAYMANDQMNIPTASITNLFMQSVDNSTGEVFEKIWVMRSNGHLSLKVVKRGE